MTPRDTQLDAWNDLQETLGEKQQRVFKVIYSHGDATMFEVAKDLGWPINRISGRITELCAKGYIQDSTRRRLNPLSGRNVIVWEPVK